jgi:uncharacterized protein YcbK (DUF882 family)
MRFGTPQARLSNDVFTGSVHVAIRVARTAGLFACPWRATRHAALASLLILFGSENLQNAAADGDTRTLAMHHMHTGEDITITYKVNGRYDDAALQKLNHFLRDWRKEEAAKMDPHLLDLIWEVYQEVGAKEPIQIVCGYRSPATNAMLRHRSSGVARFSQHMLGKAIDFYIPGVPLEQLRYAGLRMQRGGVGFYPTSGSPFVHLDTGSVRHWPRMGSDQLARVLATKPRTHYADRRPAGYQTALNEIERRNGNGDVQPVAQRSKRGLIERLFGFGEDEDEDAAGSAQPAVAAAQPGAKGESAKPQFAAAVPLPPIKPPAPTKQAKAAPPAQGQYALASLEWTPAPGPSAADVVRSRGAWETAKPPVEAPATPATAAGDVKAPPPGAPGSGQRFVWLTGPQGHPVEPAPPAPTRTAAAEPPRPPAEIPNAEQEATGTLANWPDRAERGDRAPIQPALAYAAPPDKDEVQRAAPPAPAARVAPPAAPLTRSLAAAVEPAAAVRPGMRSDNPWLRGLVISPSVHYAMSVAAFGKPDYRQVAPLMHKPAAVLAMTFSADPLPGMTSYSFSGVAVAFLPTVKMRTAGLY